MFLADLPQTDDRIAAAARGDRAAAAEVCREILPRVRNLVRFGLEPAEVPPEVIEELQLCGEKQNGVIRLNGAARQAVAAKFADSELVDFGGVFLTTDGSERVILLMRVLGDYNKVNLPEEQMEGSQAAA